MEKILLIGENIPYLDSIAEEFKKLGFSSFTAGEEEEGQKIITTEVPDVILMPQGIKRFNSLKLVFNLRDVNLLSKLVYLHREDVIPSPPDDSFYLFVPDSLSPDLIVTKIVEKIDEIHPLGEISIRDVLWMLKFEGKSAMLRVFTDEAEGEIIVVDGDPVSCKIGVDTGDKALETLVNLESIAYEIIWEIPEDVERNVVNDYEYFLGKAVTEPSGVQGEVAEGEKRLEDLSIELEKDIKELDVGEPLGEEFSFDDIPVFEEEQKEEKNEEFPWDFEDKELKIGEKGEELEEEGLKLYEDKELMEEQKSEEKPEEELRMEQLEKIEEEVPEKGEKVEKEIKLPEEFELTESIEKEEEEKEKKEEVPLQMSEGPVEKPIIEVSETVSPVEGKTIEEEEVEHVEKGIEEDFIFINEDMQRKLGDEIKQFPGIHSAVLIIEGKVVASVPHKSVDEFASFVKLNADEGYFIAGGKIFAIARKDDLTIMTSWSSGKPGFAVYGTKKVLQSIQG